MAKNLLTQFKNKFILNTFNACTENYDGGPIPTGKMINLYVSEDMGIIPYYANVISITLEEYFDPAIFVNYSHILELRVYSMDTMGSIIYKSIAQTFPKVRSITLFYDDRILEIIDYFPNLTNVTIYKHKFENAAFYAKYRHIQFVYHIDNRNIIYEPNVRFSVRSVARQLREFRSVANLVVELKINISSNDQAVILIPAYFREVRSLFVINMHKKSVIVPDFPNLETFHIYPQFEVKMKSKIHFLLDSNI
jgi:hypothetical protein